MHKIKSPAISFLARFSRRKLEMWNVISVFFQATVFKIYLQQTSAAINACVTAELKNYAILSNKRSIVSSNGLIEQINDSDDLGLQLWLGYNGSESSANRFLSVIV